MIRNTAMALALAFRAQKDEHAPGSALAVLRTSLAAQADELLAAGEKLAEAAEEIARLRRVDLNDMPPDTDDVVLLLDALTFRIGATARADAWRHIGVTPNRGREFLARNAQAVDWPIWYTLRQHALA